MAEKKIHVLTALELLAKAESKRPIVDHAPDGVVRRGVRTLGLRFAEIKVETEVANDDIGVRAKSNK